MFSYKEHAIFNLLPNLLWDKDHKMDLLSYISEKGVICFISPVFHNLEVLYSFPKVNLMRKHFPLIFYYAYYLKI